MSPDTSRDLFLQHLTAAGFTPLRGTPSAAVDAWLSFYRDVRAADCPVNASGDMLLYQWGTHDWGDGEWFELDFTRQFIINGDAEDENIWQLSLTFRYQPDDALRSIGDGNEWCDRPAPGKLDYFARFILASPAYRAVAQQVPASAELRYGCAG